MLTARLAKLCAMSSESEVTQPESAVEQIEQPIELQEPKSVSAYARAVFRKLKASLDTGHDEECFDMVQQLLKELPYDEPLNALSRRLGKKIYKQAASQLPAVLAGGKLAQVSQLVNKLRSMADVKELENLVGYRDAAAMVDAAERKRWQSSMLSALGKMRETKDLRAKEELALSIEMFSREKNLPLTPEQTAVIARVHEDWYRYCRHQKLRAEYNELRDAFHATEKEITLRRELVKCEHDLHEHYKKAETIKELPEALELMELISKQQDKVRSILVAQHRRKVIIRSSVCVAVTTALLIAAALVFTYMRASSLKAGIDSGMAEKRVHDVAELVGGIDPMRTFCKSVHQGYAEALQVADSWLKGYNSYHEEINAITPELSEATDMLTNSEVSAAELTAGLVLVDKVRKIEDKLKAEYGSGAAQEPTILMGKFRDRLAEIRPKVLGRFLKPAEGIDLKALQALYSEFLSCTSLLNVTEQETAEVRSAVQDAAAVVLRRISRSSLDPQIVQKAVDEYDSYSSSLPLRSELREELLANAERARAFAALPDTLKTVSDMQGFAAAIDACAGCYDSVQGAFSAEEARQLIGKEDNALRAYQLAGFRSAENHPLSSEQILPHLQAVKSIYSDGKNAYQLAKPKRLDFVLSRMFSNNNNVWCDGYHAVNMNRTIVVGKLNKAGRTIRIVNDKNKFLTSNNPRKLTQPQVDKAVQLHLASARKSMGLVQNDIQAGNVTPARLMLNIAQYKGKGCPAYARAYLFRFVVSLAQSMDPYSSGLAFSDSLRQDIAEFEALAARHHFFPGCWLNMHQETVDNDFEKFFDKVAARDYFAEILGSVMTVTDSHCSYAGYVNTDGAAVRKNAGNQQLYIIKNGTLTPYNGGKERAYTPLFTVELPRK